MNADLEKSLLRVYAGGGPWRISGFGAGAQELQRLVRVDIRA
jgi:hypothetical protein